jgi:RNA-directed DNA polymerase
MTVYYSLYGQLLDINNLYMGFKKVKSAKGAAGIDRQSVGAFASNLEMNLKQLQLELQTRQYRAQPVKRVEIPKDDGGVRLLGIPAVRDRIVQQALLNSKRSFRGYITPFKPNLMLKNYYQTFLSIFLE